MLTPPSIRSARFHGRCTPSLMLLVGAAAFIPAAVAPAQTIATPIVRFVIAEPTTSHNNDSYTLALTDPADIAHARDLIARGAAAGRTIIVAHMAVGANGVNRDWRASGAPVWHWHLTDFVGFSDITPEILDGWPGFIESDPAGWAANTNGMIGFWTYTVVGELPPIADPACPADINGSGSLSPQDIFDFLGAWFTSAPAADFNGEQGLTVRDIFDFLNAWFAGCV